MAPNIKFRPNEHGLLQLSVVCSHPAVPVSGNPVRWGSLVGIALVTEDSTDGLTTVAFGNLVAEFSVKGVNDSGNVAIADGDPIYYVDADTPVLSAKSSGTLAGFAKGAVTSGATATIQVQLCLSPGSGTLASQSVDGSKIANVANANVIGGVPVLFRIDIADAATGDVDVVTTHKIRVVDVHVVKTAANGGAANTVQVKNGASVISDAISININDQAIARAASIDDAQHEIAAGGTLRVTRTKAGGNAACIAYVHALRVA